MASPHDNSAPAWAPFALGFRPFFLLAGLSSVLLIAAWLALGVDRLPLPAHYDPIGWHAHEMLFGYTAAVIAGFLLTAVRNWTGIETARGAPLAALAALWLAGRLLPWLPGVPGALVAAVDVAFLPALAATLFGPLRGGSNRMNLVLLPILLGMAVANGLVHAQALGHSLTGRALGTTLMLDLVLGLVLLVTGRVMPFFTEMGLAGARPTVRRPVEIGGVALMAVLAVLHLAGVHGPLLAVVAGAMGLLQAVRLAGWYQRGLFSVPILAVLYSGYGWLVAGFVLHALAAAGAFPSSPALHAFTVGAIGVLTLGMMARVALGHTGRPMRSALAVDAAFVLLNAGAVVRVLMTAAVPAWHGTWLYLSGFLWLAAFAIFTAVYAPILLRPRVDGQPG